MIPQCHLLAFISIVCLISMMREETALKQTWCNYPVFASQSVLHMNMNVTSQTQKREEEAVLFHLPKSLYSDVPCQINRTMLSSH